MHSQCITRRLLLFMAPARLAASLFLAMSWVLPAIPLLAAPGSPAAENLPARGLYEAARSERFLDGKIRAARRLANLRSPDSFTLLATLLDDDHYWNRAAAAEGLLTLADPAADRLLLPKFLDDHMIRDRIAAGFMAAMSRVLPLLREGYAGREDTGDRNRILVVVASSGDPRGEAWLKEIIDHPPSDERVFAFQCLTRHYSGNNLAYIQGFLADPELKEPAMVFLLESDRRDSLPFFRQTLAGPPDPRVAALCYRAVQQWGDAALRQSTFLQALADEDELRLQGALLAFPDVRSREIREGLCAVVRRARLQPTRVMAGDQLARYDTSAVVPTLVALLGETYAPREKTIADLFGTAITAGFFALLSDGAQMSEKSGFDAWRKRLAQSLRRLTGAEIGPDHDRWLEWAVLRGYTVEGQNILQFLFAASPARRALAVEHASRLLGFTGREAFLGARPALAGAAEPALLLALAGELLARGLLKDEPGGTH